MTDHIPEDLDPAGRDLRGYTDQLRADHDVVRSVRGEWVLLRHADVRAAALDHRTFSSAVSAHLQVPNGLDGEAHAAARETLDAYFTEAALAPFAEVFTAVATDLLATTPPDEPIDAVDDLGARFAVRAQSAWLGWPADLEDTLLDWMATNHAASRSGDRDRTRRVAEDFDAIIRSILEPRRAPGVAAPPDLTTRLMRDTIAGRPVTDEELVSVLRNWTGGDLGSIALCVGVLFEYLAANPELQPQLVALPDPELDAAIDEILRIDDPFPANRRRTTCPVRIGGADIPADAVVKLHWTSANRDEAVVGAPNRFDPARNAEHNLVYGIGKHVCPGRPLATMQLRILLRVTLDHRRILPADTTPEREVAPVGGFRRVPVLVSAP